MPRFPFDPNVPIWSQLDALEMVQPDESTLDSWCRYRHLVPHTIAGRRVYSFADLLNIDLMWMLARIFRADITVAVLIARELVDRYLAKHIAEDVSGIKAGESWSAVSDQEEITYGLVRDLDGTLRETRRGEIKVDEVMIVVPVRLLARRLLEPVLKRLG